MRLVRAGEKRAVRCGGRCSPIVSFSSRRLHHLPGATSPRARGPESSFTRPELPTGERLRLQQLFDVGDHFWRPPQAGGGKPGAQRSWPGLPAPWSGALSSCGPRCREAMPYGPPHPRHVATMDSSQPLGPWGSSSTTHLECPARCGRIWGLCPCGPLLGMERMMLAPRGFAAELRASRPPAMVRGAYMEHLTFRDSQGPSGAVIVQVGSFLLG